MAALFPAPFSVYFDDDGNPLSGGKVYTYEANSETPLATYSNAAGTLNTNPVTLDAAGRADIWFDGSKLYKIVLKTSTGTTIKTVDYVGSTSDGISFLQSGSGAVSRTVQSKLRDTVSVKDFGAVGDGVTDDTAALNAAFAKVGYTVLMPKGTYLITSNLNPPTCSAIIGDGWEPGTAGSGTWIAASTGVTTVLNLYDTKCQSVENLGIAGNATTNAVGILIGDRTSAPYTWDYGVIKQVRVSGFTGTGGKGMYLRNANFCSFHDLAIDNCTQCLVSCVASVAAGTVPADCWFYNPEFSSSTNELIAMYSGFLTMYSPRLSGAGTEAITIDPASGAINTHTATLWISNPAFENISQADPTLFHIKLIGSTSANAVDFHMDGCASLEISASDPRFISVNGGYCRAKVRGVQVYAQPKAYWINVVNGGRLTYEDQDVTSTAGIYNVAQTANAVFVGGTSVVDGNNIIRTFTPSFTNLTTVGSVATAGKMIRNGNVVHWLVTITPSGGGTSASAGITTTCKVDSSEADIGRPLTGVPFPVSASSATGAAGVITGTGKVSDSANKWTLYCPVWSATTDTIYLSGTFFADALF